MTPIGPETQTTAPLPLIEPGVLFRVAAALAYGLLCVLIYERLSYQWYYFGFLWNNPSTADIVAAILLSAVPAIFLPRGARDLMQFAAWTLYFAVFAPTIIIPVLQRLQSAQEVWLLVGLIAAGASAFGWISRFNLSALPVAVQFRVSQRTIIGLLLALFFGGYGYILILHSGDLNFASFSDVYEQRAEFAEGAGGLLSYAVPILANVVNPMLLAIGLKRRSPALIALGIGGAALSYGTFALKQHILTPGFVIGTYVLFDRMGRCRVLALPLTLILISVLCYPFVATYDPNAGVFSMILTLLFVRTLLLPGVITGLFASYFSIYEHTNFAHSSVGRLFAAYPYGDLSVGQVVGYYLLPSSGGNLWELNGSFVATDGIASLGAVGVCAAFAIAIVVLRVMAVATVKVDRRIVFPSAIPFLITLANTSLFSSMLTGGGIFLTALLYLWGNAEETAPSRPADLPAGAGRPHAAVR